MADTAIVENEKLSVREFYPGTWGGLVGDGIGILWPGQSGLIRPWGSAGCDVDLRNMFYMLHNTLIQGAFNLFIQNVLSTPFEMSGGRNQTYKWQDIFFEADFGEGYDVMLGKGLLDLLTLNRGMFLEKVSYGDPDTPIKEGARILAINHLDALRIVMTGNLEYPYLYYSEQTSKMHRLHRTRVIHLVDQPTANTRLPGVGMSALYRAMTVANAQILLGRHQNEMLSDLPPPGLVIFNNVKGEQVEDVMTVFEADRRRDGQSVYRAPVRMEGLNPNEPVSVTFVPLAQVPEGFDYEKYMQTHVNLTALAAGMDPQDIWPLTGAPMGSGQQSKILASKTAGKGYGYWLTRLERVWNTATPRPIEFKYKAQNTEEGIEQANIAKTWTEVINGASFATEQEKRQLAANQIPAFADVLMDEQGNVRLPDDDPKDPAEDVMVEDASQAPGEEAIPIEDQATADDTEQAGKSLRIWRKEFDATYDEFVDEIGAILEDAADGDLNKAAFSARMRTAINTYGRLAFLDGLETGGVDQSTLDDEDKSTVATILAEQSKYVSNVASEIFNSDGGFKGSPTFRAELWGQKTLQSFYYAGVESADKNGMYEFIGDDGAESCSTCKKLKGQVHRMKDWTKKRLRPGLDTDQFDCGGWQCHHYLQKTSGKASGNWKSIEFDYRLLVA